MADILVNLTSKNDGLDRTVIRVGERPVIDIQRNGRVRTALAVYDACR